MGALNPAFWTFVAVIAGIYAIMALGLYVQFSLAGLPNFGHVAFMAVAAYTMAILIVRYGVPLPLAGAACIGASIILALVMGVPALRLRADYLAIATVAGGEIIRYLALNLPDDLRLNALKWVHPLSDCLDHHKADLLWHLAASSAI